MKMLSAVLFALALMAASSSSFAATDPYAASGPTTVAKKDLKFFTEASQAGMKEVKAGELAQQRGMAAETKTLADMMIKDHTAKGDELKAIATKKGVTLPTQLKKDYQSDIEKLSKTEPAKFDKAYAEMMVSDHKKVISLFEDQSKKSKDQDLLMFTKETIPALKHHLEMSEGDAKM